MMHKDKICLIGKKFGRLSVFSESNNKPLSKNGYPRKGVVYICICDCGNTHEVYKADLLSGKKSCGCISLGGHNIKDLTGGVFGDLSVLSRAETPKKHKGKSTAAFWNCVCACGRETVVMGHSLYKGKTKSCGCRARLSPKYNIINQKFNKLKVVSRYEKNTNRGLARWVCICDCGEESVVTGSDLRQGRKKSCGCLTKRSKDKNPHWKGYEGLYRSYWTRLVRGAEVRGLTFDIIIEYAWELFLKQDKKCALSGLPIEQPVGGKNKPNDASLDRIDNTRGYIKGNVQWVHKHINKMKLDFKQDYFITLCREVAQLHEDT